MGMCFEYDAVTTLNNFSAKVNVLIIFLNRSGSMTKGFSLQETYLTTLHQWVAPVDILE